MAGAHSRLIHETSSIPWSVQTGKQAHQEIGFDYYNLPSRDGSMYWSEGVAYEFSLKQIEQLEDASNELHQMCLEVAGDMIQRGHYPEYFQIPQQRFL